MFPDIARDDIFRLETARLWLRWPRASDAAAIERYSGLWEVARFTARIPHPYRDSDARRFVLAARESNLSGRDLTLVMTPTRGNREAIGAVSLESTGVDRLTLGYALHPEFWGRGFASEAVAAMIEAAFSLTPVVEIDADVRVENAPSRRVLEKVGLRHVGTGLRDAPARGAVVNCDRFAVTRSEWAARPKARFASESVDEIS